MEDPNLSLKDNSESVPPSEPEFVAWTADEVRIWRESHPQQSVWRVVFIQGVTGVVLSLATMIFSGSSAGFYSVAYGSLCVMLPTAVFARGMTSAWSKMSLGSAITGFFVWELVKIGMTIVMLGLSTRLIDSLSWPLMILGLILTMKAHWFFLLGLRSKTKHEK